MDYGFKRKKLPIGWIVYSIIMTVMCLFLLAQCVAGQAAVIARANAEPKWQFVAAFEDIAIFERNVDGKWETKVEPWS